MLQQPLLYLSLYFKTHRQEYYERLNQVRLSGDWESWLLYFGEATEQTANDAVETAKKLIAQSEQDTKIIQNQERYAGTLSQIYQVILRRPVVTAAWVKTNTDLAPATIQSGLKKLEKLSIFRY